MQDETREPTAQKTADNSQDQINQDIRLGLHYQVSKETGYQSNYKRSENTHNLFSFFAPIQILNFSTGVLTGNSTKDVPEYTLQIALTRFDWKCIIALITPPGVVSGWNAGREGWPPAESLHRNLLLKSSGVMPKKSL
jgi:hypothetical protein